LIAELDDAVADPLREAVRIIEARGQRLADEHREGAHRLLAEVL
jgi:hypothetical protein